MKNTTNTTDHNREKFFKKIISKMTTEQIEQRSLLVGMSEKTPDNILFQKLLTLEYTKRQMEDEISKMTFDEIHDKVENSDLSKEPELYRKLLYSSYYNHKISGYKTTLRKYNQKKFDKLEKEYFDTLNEWKRLVDEHRYEGILQDSAEIISYDVDGYYEEADYVDTDYQYEKFQELLPDLKKSLESYKLLVKFTNEYKPKFG